MVSVVPDVTGIDRSFDYFVPDELVPVIGIGSRVRISLHGRRVGGWVESFNDPDEVSARTGVEVSKLKRIEKSSGLGPDVEVLELSRWASHRWAAHRLRPFLVAASPDTVVHRVPPPRHTKVLAEPVSPAATRLLADGGGVLRLPPTADQMPTILAAARRGPTLVVCANVDAARVLATRLRRTGVSIAFVPDEWPAARGGVDVVIGARAAAFAPCPGLAAAVVLDEHEETLQEERVPTWHARDVVSERARRAGAPLLLVSPCPSVVGLQGRRLVAPTREREREAWPSVDVVDRGDEEPWKRSLLSGDLISHLRANGLRVACVLNTKGQARLLACRGCGALVRCSECDLAMVEAVESRLDCGGCGASRDRLCASCGSTALARLKPGVARLRDEIEMAAGRDVLAVTGVDRETVDDSAADVFVGTEAVLHRVRRLDVVAFLDFDAELLAPRYRAAEQALALVARAARAVGPRRGGGRVLLQTTLPDHEVVRASVAADPAIVSDSEISRRRLLRLPPESALAVVEGDGADSFAAGLAGLAGLDVVPHRDRWLVRAPAPDVLADALAANPKPAGSKLRIEVDPPRI